jgi:hypothetical protein
MHHRHHHHCCCCCCSYHECATIIFCAVHKLRIVDVFCEGRLRSDCSYFRQCLVTIFSCVLHKLGLVGTVYEGRLRPDSHHQS